MVETSTKPTRAPVRTSLTRATIGTCAATFFSDVGHERVTAARPAHLASFGLGATAAWTMVGVTDLLQARRWLGGTPRSEEAARKPCR